jgi:hypothetical protein
MTLTIPRTIRLLLPSGTVKTVELEAYVRGVVASALPADSPLEALKAQAVAARTFGASTKRHADRGADVCTLRHCQVWKENLPTSRRASQSTSGLIERAVEATRGIVAVADGELIDAFYFDHCDGRTRDAAGVLLQAPAYLREVNCPCGFATLKGHGVGMCQRGALVMARFGETFDYILRHYYSGITLERAKAVAQLDTLTKAPAAPHESEATPSSTPSESKPPAVISPPRETTSRKTALDKTSLDGAPFGAVSADANKRVVLTSPAQTKPPSSEHPTQKIAPKTTPAKKSRAAKPTALEAAKQEVSPEKPSPTPIAQEKEAELPPSTIEFSPIETPLKTQAVSAETAPTIQPRETAASNASVESTTQPPSQPVNETLGIEDTSWYPTADEMASTAAVSAAESLTEDSSPPLSAGDEFAHNVVGATEADVLSPAPSEQIFTPPDFPESLPEPLPIFTPLTEAGPARVQPPPRETHSPSPLSIETKAAPPPPLVEDAIGESLAPPIEKILVDHLPGPRVIAGNLSRAGIIVTIRDADGHSVVTVSGMAKHYGAGGFEAPVSDDGSYAISFDHEAVNVKLKDETVFIHSAE